MSAGLLVLAVMAAVATTVTGASLNAAEQERLDERRRLVRQLGDFTNRAYGTEALEAAAERTPFPRDDPAVAARLLQQFRTSGIGEPTALAAVVRRDGSVLAISPAGATPPLADLGEAWDAALEGTATRTASFDYGGENAWATTVPIGLGRPWGVLVVVQPTLDLSAQLFMQKVGTLKTGEGGLFSLDPVGRVNNSWNPATVGRMVADGKALTSHPVGAVVTTTRGRGADEVTTVSMRTSMGLTVGFEQRTEDLFADLRSEQRRRSLTLLAVFAIAALGLLTATVRRLRTVRANRARLDALLHNAQDLVLVAAPDGTLTFVSPAIRQLLGHDAREWLGRPLLDLASGRDAELLREVFADPGAKRDPVDIRLRTSTGGHRWFDVEAGDVTANPDLRGVLFTCREIGRRKELQEELTHQARHDALSGLPNRTVLTELLSDLLETDHPALLFVDLDRFKHVNDTWGHAAGDEVLRVVAERLAGVLGPDDVACRFGGDEFGVVLPEATERRAVEVARRIAAAAAEPITLANGEVAEIGASIGVALPAEDDDAESLLRAADEAMYRAKQDRRGGYVVRTGTPGEPGPGHLAVRPDVVTATPVPEPAAPAELRPSSAAGEPAAGPPAGPAAAPEQPARASTSGRAGERRLLVSLAPLIAATVAIVSIAGFGVWQTREARQSAERERVAERLRLTEGVAEYATVIANPQRLLAPINAAPWALDGSIVDTLVLQAIVASDLGGEGARVALRDLAGGELASAGDAAPPGITTGDRAWRAALAGRVGYVPLIESDGKHYGGYAIPILRDGRPAAVLVVAPLLRESLGQRLLEALGSLGFGEGGISVVERGGRVVTSWNGAGIGTRMLDAGVVPSLPAGRASVVDGPPGDVTLAASIASTRDLDPKAAVFRQPVGTFYGDLRTGQTARDLTLLATVLLAVGLLVTATWRRERALRRSERRLDALLRNSHDIVAILDRETATFVSSAMTGLLGHDPHTWLHRPWQELVHADDVERLGRHVQGQLGTARDIRLAHADGGHRWFDVASADLRSHRALRGFVVTAHEVGERKRLQAELAHNATHDALTGLLNRVTFTRRLDAVAATGDDDYAVLFIDLDRFKPVNDTFGHDAGDAVLRTVAERLRARVPADGVVCRLGGDEFAVLLTGKHAYRASRVADAILECLREPVPLPRGEGVVRIDSTIGIARSDGDNPADVLRHADLAMYQGKQDGRGQVAVFG
jgi:diguanylate cyclase (GGDEF)-like protein/PAS domain S-box-containing protein